MDQDEEEHMQQFEDYCRKLGLQVRNESDVSSMAVDEVSVLGVAVSEGEKPDEDSLPIPAGHAKLQATNYSHFDCKDCSRRFASSRQFVKHKCLSKTEEGLAKSPGKKPGRKPRPRKRAKAAKAEERGEANAADTTKAESLSLKGDNIDHSSDQLSIKGTNDHDDVSDQIAADGVQNTDCESCQLLPELDPVGNIKSKKIPCEKCLELNVSSTPSASEKNKMSGEKVKKRKYGFKTEKQLCPHCNQGFHSAKRYEKHLTICRKNLLCSFCGKDFSNNGRMAYVQYQAHYYTHVEQKPFSCEICKRGFIRKADLDRHKIIHTEEYEPQRCEQCGAVFSTKENLEKHKKKHEQPRWVCTKCRQTFARESACEKHMKNCQTQINCEICGKKFQCLSKNIKSRYQEHMYTHTGEKPYKCQFCERGFRDRSTRRKHERTHTGEKPYPCTICERAFSQLRLLRNHVRTHTGEKPYACELCELSFAKSCNLKYHMRVHTKEKPYSCDICQKSFTQSGTYHKHMRRHKGVVKDNAATTIQFESSSTTTNDISAKAQFPSNAGTETDQKPDESFNTADRTISPDAAQPVVGNKEMESSPLVCPEIASDTSEIVIKDNSPPAQDSPAQVGEMPLSGEEITIIVSEGDGVTAALASIDVDQISSILASCS